jgi:hypothetical protein
MNYRQYLKRKIMGIIIQIQLKQKGKSLENVINEGLTI